jgi:selenocysteine lyase/cysteine desulfurase
MEEHLKRRDDLACTDFLSWFDDADKIRGDIGRLIGCEPDGISFLSTSCAALSLFLSGIDWKAGDRIVTLADEFPNQYYYARWLERQGAELVVVAEIDRLPARTRAVILSSVNYMSGYRPDLTVISDIAHAAGALLFIDGTQSLGALTFDVRRIRPDMFAVDSYKWMLAPNGASFFYISPELRRTLTPAVIGWRSHRNWRDIENLHQGAPEFPASAERYEGGMLNFPSLYALGESVRMLLEIGPARIEKRVLGLARYAAEKLSRSGGSVSHTNSNIVAAQWPGRDLSALAGELRSSRIVVSARKGNLRVSPHFYNDESDIDVLTSAL